MCCIVPGTSRLSMSPVTRTDYAKLDNYTTKRMHKTNQTICFPREL